MHFLAFVSNVSSKGGTERYRYTDIHFSSVTLFLVTMRRPVLSSASVLTFVRHLSACWSPSITLPKLDRQIPNRFDPCILLVQATKEPFIKLLVSDALLVTMRRPSLSSAKCPHLTATSRRVRVLQSRSPNWTDTDVDIVFQMWSPRSTA